MEGESNQVTPLGKSTRQVGSEINNSKARNRTSPSRVGGLARLGMAIETEGRSVQPMITNSARRLAEKLNTEIEKGNDTSAYMIALTLAICKDFSDFLLTLLAVGLIPGVNFCIGLFLTSFLFFFLLRKGWFLKTRIKFWYWVLGLFVDGLPAVSALPMNTLLVIYAWRLAKKRAGRAKEKMADLYNLTGREIDELNNDISLLED